MVRAPYYDKNGLKKGAWTREEDDKLRNYIKRYGAWNWRQLPKFAGLARCGKSCRLRWLNYLHPGLKHGNYSKEEEDLIVKLHAEHGNKWSLIAAKLPGRTDNEIKNYWHAHLKKRAEQEKLEKLEKRTVLPDLNMPDESNDEQSSEEAVELNRSDESSQEVIDLNKSDEFNDEQSSEELIDLNKSDEQSSEDVPDLNRFDRFNDEQSSEEASQSEISQL